MSIAMGMVLALTRRHTRGGIAKGGLSLFESRAARKAS
jgi:hypothetical protein